MASGKKGKKSKGVTMDLNSFLGSADGGAPPVKSTSWADDVDDEYESYASSKAKEQISLPTAPRAARDISLNEDNIPSNPPFNAYLSNLPYEADEQDIHEFFADLKVVNVNIPPSKDGNKSRGVGYVEFEDRQSLIDALNKPNLLLKNRRIRIEVSNSSSDDRRGRMGRMGDSRRDDRYGDPERTTGDWRSGPREEMRPDDNDRYRSRGGFDRDSRRDDRDDSDNRPGGWRDDNRSRLALRDEGREQSRFGNDRGSRDRESDRDRFGPRRNYGDSTRDWDRSTNRPPPLERDAEPASSEPRTRPVLKLQPRSKPVEPIIVEKSKESEDQSEGETTEPNKPVESSEPKPAPAPVPAANIFGAAKPVDTAARERQIEERLRNEAELKTKEESDSDRGDKRGMKNGTWNRRDDDKEREPRKPETWRSDGDREKNFDKPPARSQAVAPRNDRERGEYRAPQRSTSPRRAAPPPSRPPARAVEKSVDEKERKAEKEDEPIKMPKARDEEAPNFVASNKYSMLPEEDADE